jgi:hypothetical protein
MKLNKLRGTVADRPIDSQVIQTDVQRTHPDSFTSGNVESQHRQSNLSPLNVNSLIDRLADLVRGQHIVRQVDIGDLPVYDLG